MPHGLDTDQAVFFYEQEFYPLSNFSAFRLTWKGHKFQTSEHAYQWEKFAKTSAESATQVLIRIAESAHEAFKLGQMYYRDVRTDWPQVRVGTMLNILHCKVKQHPYVRKKLIETGTRTIIENSWRDAFWGWGPDRNGQNTLGELWMQVRAEILAQNKVG